MFDEMLDGPGDEGRDPYRALLSWLADQDVRKLSKQSIQAEPLYAHFGITSDAIVLWAREVLGS